MRFHRKYPITRSVVAFAVVSRSDRHKLRSCRFSLTDAWPALTENLFPGSAREGYASILRPSLWLLVVVCGGWVLLEFRDMARVSHAPTLAMTCSFRRGQWLFFCLDCIFLYFHSVSLQWADIIWIFRWLYARPCLLSLVGLCFIVLRGSNVCCNVSLLYLIAALSRFFS